MAEVNTRYMFEFKSDDKKRVIELEGDFEFPYKEARDKLKSEINISTQNFESRWDCSKSTYYSFSSPPWDSMDEVGEFLSGIDGVSSARYVPPMESYYGPPKYVLRLSARDSMESIKDTVNDYYDGLLTDEVTNQKLCVTVSPVRYVSQR